MKNAMKKLMSLMLVAVLLVSAVPFAASAATVPVTIYQAVDGQDVITTANFDKDAERATIAEICAAVGISEADFEGAWVTTDKEYKKGYGDDIPTASTLKIRKVAVTTTPTVLTCPDCGGTYNEGTTHTCPVPVAPIKIVVKVDSSDNIVWEGTKVPSNGQYALVGDLLTHCWNKSWENSYTFKHAYAYRADGSKGYVETLDGQINAGEEVHILVTTKTVDYTPGTGTTPTNKFKWDIYLNIYTNNKVDAPAKTVKINDTIALDNKVSLDEALTIVDDYYYATDSTKGIILDGLYKGMGNWALQFVTDSGKADAFTNLDSAREENYVFINVMATNVTARGTATADSSNPKTGDTIFAPIFVLGLSASALAVMFYLNKKRAF